jgi:hypothetical protein
MSLESRLRELLAVPLCLRSREEGDEVEAALPKLLECVDLLRDVQTIVGSQQSRDRIRAALASLEDPS